MTNKVDRRSFLRQSVIASTATLGMSLEEKALLARADAKAVPGASDDFPKGKLRDLQISRVICGGNLISGFAHSRDLIYVSDLLRNYFTDEKVCETLQICEENGLNTAILRVDQHTLRIINKYWNNIKLIRFSNLFCATLKRLNTFIFVSLTFWKNIYI